MKKKNLVSIVIVAFICIAVYLNFNTVETAESDEVRVENTLGEVTSQETVNEDGTEVSDIGAYFDEARLEKQKARDSAISTLQEAVLETTLSQESRDSAARSIETISNGAVSEARIETLIKAKGYAECVALMNESGVNVIVASPKEGLSPADTTKIKDIVVGETKVSPGQIKIIEIK